MTTLCLDDYTPPRQPMSSCQMAAIRFSVYLIGTAWAVSPAVITQSRRAALDAVAEGVTATEAMHRAIDVLSGTRRLR